MKMIKNVTTNYRISLLRNSQCENALPRARKHRFSLKPNNKVPRQTSQIRTRPTAIKWSVNETEVKL